MDSMIENPQIISKYVIKTPKNRGIGGGKSHLITILHVIVPNLPDIVCIETPPFSKLAFTVWPEPI